MYAYVCLYVSMYVCLVKLSADFESLQSMFDATPPQSIIAFELENECELHSANWQSNTYNKVQNFS